ncbi:MAG: NAD+ synthase [Planctomycetes bacterium]|nr:NAD+ synthase [Planctomycetota bacterium]MCP4771135.1 NAD+ synthase [Planctomycetota bacterium]MCP4862138.1 NAD+ synthase [Planctomycetota bacterium]
MSALPPPPGCNVELTKRVLVGFLREETHRVGMTRAVLGLSGGIDSALVIELAVRALGPENVLAVAMPYRESHPDSLLLARESAQHAGVELEVADISPMADGYLENNPDLDDKSLESVRLRRGNVFSRLRMTTLYDRSAKLGGLVFGTSNKTELMLGYGTQHGDMASGINPIGDLYKSQVVALSRHLGVPSEIIDRPPSADLWAGQTDEDELGFTYDSIDALLFRLIDRRESRESLIEQGFQADFIDTISKRVRINQYKRRPPLIAKVAARTVNLDYRYARDWGT